MVIRPKAHLFTALSLLWVALSALGVLLFSDYHRNHASRIDLVVALAIWACQVVFVALSVHFWSTEGERKTTVFDAFR